MIDLHCHILPNIDDGPSDITDSIKMAMIAAEDGIKKIVATPHIDHTNTSSSFDGNTLLEHIGEQVEFLNSCLKAEQIPVKILGGGEVSALVAPETQKHYTINRTPYLIVEFPHTHLPSDARETIFNMVLSGLKPIISHPERNPSVAQDPERLSALVEGGARVQVTAASITGEFGRDTQALSHHLLREHIVSFVVSDGHSINGRPPVLSAAFKTVKKRFGRKYADALFVKNPEAVIAGGHVG